MSTDGAGFRGAGITLQHDIAVAEQGDSEGLHNRFLADDRALHFIYKALYLWQ